MSPASQAARKGKLCNSRLDRVTRRGTPAAANCDGPLTTKPYRGGFNGWTKHTECAAKCAHHCLGRSCRRYRVVADTTDRLCCALGVNAGGDVTANVQRRAQG